MANDPNKFLFDDIPAAFGGHGALDNDEGIKSVVDDVRQGLEELVQSYPSMLRRLNDLMLSELQVPNSSPQSLAELRARAENVKDIGGDFRLNAFVGRLSEFSGGEEGIEGLASLAANKPPRDWTDSDLDRAALEIANLAQMFVKAENFARVKGRVDMLVEMLQTISTEFRRQRETAATRQRLADRLQFARQIRVLRFRTPCEAHRGTLASKPDAFIVKPGHRMPGPGSRGLIRDSSSGGFRIVRRQSSPQPG